MLKVLFNACAKPGKDYRVPYDRWTITDTVSGLLTLTGYPIIVSMTPESMIDKQQKDYIDILMLSMIFMQW